MTIHTEARAVLPFDGGSEITDPLLKRIYGGRGIRSYKELSRSLAELPDPARLKGIAAAVGLLVEALEQQQFILIIGDFDADGATSSALMMLALQALGYTRLDYLVPNRFDYGYGLTPEIVEQARSYRPDLIITVDNGIASHDGVALAQQYGIKVVVTDHHLPGLTLPPADAIVNPNQPGCEFPSKAIAGVGVAFFLLLALRARLREAGWFQRAGINPPKLADYLDIVAVGTVADVVPLDQTNRILVHQGLQRIKAGRCRPGIKALLQYARRDFQHIAAADLGFAIGPRLNAAGRLDDISVGIACLLADSELEANLMAAELDALNADRRQIEQGMQQQAENIMQSLLLDRSTLPPVVCLYDENWHQGVVGIVASRLKERYHRPVIVFAKADNGQLKGSARSIPGIHIRDVLATVAAADPALVHKFGGHAMAAGLTLAETAALERLRQQLARAIAEMYDDSVFINTVRTDGVLAGDQITIESARLLEQAGPWGQNFPEPLFEGSYKVLDRRVLSGRHVKLKLAVPGGPAAAVEAICFNAAEAMLTAENLDEVAVVHTLSINRWRGAESVQFVIKQV